MMPTWRCRCAMPPAGEPSHLPALRLDATPRGLSRNWRCNPPRGKWIHRLHPCASCRWNRMTIPPAHPVCPLRWQGGDCTLKLDPPRPLLVNRLPLLRRPDDRCWLESGCCRGCLRAAGALQAAAAAQPRRNRSPVSEGAQLYGVWSGGAPQPGDAVDAGTWIVTTPCCTGITTWRAYWKPRVTSQPVQQAARLSRR